MAITTIVTVFLGLPEVDSVPPNVGPYRQVQVPAAKGGDRILVIEVVAGTVTIGGTPAPNPIGLDVSGHFAEFSPENGVLLQKAGIDLSAATIIATLQRGRDG